MEKYLSLSISVIIKNYYIHLFSYIKIIMDSVNYRSETASVVETHIHKQNAIIVVVAYERCYIKESFITRFASFHLE